MASLFRSAALPARRWVLLVAVLTFASAVLAGCVEPGDPGGEEGEETGAPLVAVVEVYDGDLVTAQVSGEASYSQDQLGDIHREFWIMEGTPRVELALRTTTADLRLRATPPGCGVDDACAFEFTTTMGRGNITLLDPAPGAWMVYLYMADHQTTSAPLLGGIVPGAAGDVPYRLTVTKEQPPHPAVSQERYEGTLVAAHLGVIRISPDQLGEVYREFWVHEGTRELVLEFEADQDVALAVGQSFRGRDRFTEETHNTEGGSKTLVFTDPPAGGWYFIVFHHSDTGPNVAQVSYTMEVLKDRASADPAGITEA